MDTNVDLGLSLGWRISRHAHEAAQRRGITSKQILACLVAPDLTYPSHGQQVWRRGSLAIVVDPVTQTVITVLLAANDPWTDRDARRAFGSAA